MKDIFVGILVSAALYLFFGWLAARDQINELREVARLSCQVHPRYVSIGEFERPEGAAPRAACDYIERKNPAAVNVKGTL